MMSVSALIESYTPALLEALEAPSANGKQHAVQERFVRSFAGDVLGLAPAGVSLLAGGSPDRTLEEFLASTAVNIALPGVDIHQRRRLFETFRAITEAVSRYVPQPYDWPITLFAASEISLEDVSRGWSPLAHGGLRFHELPGDHYSILKTPQVAELASILSRYLGAHSEGESPHSHLLAAFAAPGME